MGVGSPCAPMPKEVGSLSSPEKFNNKGLFGALYVAFDGYRKFRTISRTGVLTAEVTNEQ